MSFLDDLKNQAADRKQKEQLEQQRQEQLQQTYQQDIHPRMVEVYTYLNEMIKHLNYLDTDTKASYPISPDKSKRAFRQADYKVTIDSANSIKNITLKFSCSLDSKLEYEVEGKKAIDAYNDWLNDYNLKFYRKDYKDDNYELLSSRFLLEGPIYVTVQFIGDVENSGVNLFFRNIEKPGISKSVLKARHLTRDFMDDLARYLLREDEKFLSLDISETEKQTIREKLQQEKARREQELLEAELQAEQQALANKKNFTSLFGRKK